MSHAKNWVDYGFIGINPSGGRVEGYSAPVQFFVYTLFYGLLRTPYALFANIQTIACTFLLGFLVSRFYLGNKNLGIILTSLVAVILINLTSFLEWHGSGMENPITHVLFILSVLLIYRSAESGKITYWMSIFVFLASISRLESVFHIAPLLVIFSAYGFTVHKSDRALRFSVLVFMLWVFFHLWRYWYFGEIIPNTAHAQGISVIENLRSLISDEPGLLMSSAGNSVLIFIFHGGFLLVPLSYLLFLKNKDNSLIFLMMISASLVLTGLLNPLVFGSTRLDPTRSTTHVAVVIAASIPLLVYLAERQRRRRWRMPTIYAACLIVLSIIKIEPYDVCCSTGGFDDIRATFDTAARAERLPRPTVSNPDLGIVSWGKQFNIVDLGRLGSPIMAKLPAGPLLVDYFFDYAAPDLIESHGFWTCRYFSTIFTDSRFSERYVSWGDDVSLTNACDEGKQPPVGYWIRRDILANSGSEERRLIDDLQADLSSERLLRALTICQGLEERSCTYVARTAYRFLPEFIDLGLHDDLVAVFQNSRTREFDLYLINGRNDGQAHMAAIDHIMSRHLDQIPSR